MSESIWNKTYTLGNSQETEIVGGTGIKVDDSVPGVIGISNDETVLWENSANNQYSATLSEAYSNFERVRIEFFASDTMNTNRTVYNEFPGYVTQFNLIGQRTDDGGIVMSLSDLSASNDKTRLTPTYGRYVIVPKTSTSLSVGNMNIALKSVVGINRISGGN